MVIYLGTVGEDGPTAEIVRNPPHPYTRDRGSHAFARCAEETPALRATADGHRVACHLDG